MRLACYVRVSSEEQVKEGVSLEGQEARLRAWAPLLGHEIVEVFSDPGISGAVPPGDRPGFLAALTLIRAGGADAIAAVALDRISRSVTDILALSQEFSYRGWGLLSLRESIDPKTPLGRLFLTFLAGMAQYERELIGERTSVAIQQLKAGGARFCSRIPYGKALSEDGKTLIPCEDEIAVLSKITAMHDRGLTSEKIAYALNDEGILHPRLKREWGHRDVHGVFRSLRRSGQMPRRPGQMPRRKRTKKAA